MDEGIKVGEVDEAASQHRILFSCSAFVGVLFVVCALKRVCRGRTGGINVGEIDEAESQRVKHVGVSYKAGCVVGLLSAWFVVCRFRGANLLVNKQSRPSRMAGCGVMW